MSKALPGQSSYMLPAHLAPQGSGAHQNLITGSDDIAPQGEFDRIAKKTDQIIPNHGYDEFNLNPEDVGKWERHPEISPNPLVLDQLIPQPDASETEIGIGQTIVRGVVAR